MLVNILSSFRYAHGGIRVQEYAPAPAVDLPDEVATEALREGWAEVCEQPKKITVREPEAKPKARRRIRK